MSRKRWKVAFIGAGSMATEHLRVFAAMDDVVLSGIHSRTRSKAEQLAVEFNITTVSETPEELYRETAADLVVITVPELQLKKVINTACRFPWAILMEKPAGYNLEDATEIARMASAHPSPVMVAFNRRCYSSTSAVASDLDQRPGEKRFIHVQDQQSFAEARHYGHPEEVVEKFMYANSIHMIDLIPMFGRGSIQEVRRITPWLGGQTETMLAYVVFDSGDTALYEGLWTGPGPWACSVATSSRRWTLAPLEQASFQNLGERTKHTVEISEVDKMYKPGFFVQARSVIDCLNGLESPLVDLEKSLATMRLINRIFGV